MKLEPATNLGTVKYILIALLALNATTTLGTTNTFSRSTRVQSTDIETLLDRIETRYKAMRGLAADFEQSYTAPGARDRHERGRLFLQRPRRMRWEYDTTPAKLFIVNNREVWFYVPADREAFRADAARVTDARFPFLFLLGQIAWRKEFNKFEFAPGDSGDSSGPRTLRLVPRRKNTGVREIFVTATPDGKITEIATVDDAGARSNFTLTNVREDYNAPADAFEFNPPPGVTVRRQ